jgi:hypothetical protein
MDITYVTTKYGVDGQVLGVYLTVEDETYQNKYLVTPFMVEPLSCKFKKLEIPKGLNVSVTYYLPFEHIDACLDALEYAQERGRGGIVTPKTSEELLVCT